MANCEKDLLPDVANMDKIEEGLYLGNLTAAIEIQTLLKHFISHILTVDSKPLPDMITSLPGMSFLFIQVNDMANEDLLGHFEEAIEFINDGQKKGNVLVHCYFGVSRSATLVTCFLMKKYELSVDEALQRVKAKRRCVGPNSGFLAQLLLFQTMRWSLMENNTQYRLYRLQAAAASFVKGEKQQLGEKYRSLMQPASLNDSGQNKVAYKCRKCRCSLIYEDSILPHFERESPVWSDEKWSKIIDKNLLCTKGIFTLPLSWMTDVTSNLQGKLLCPRCQAKVGSFNWCAGCRCPCEAKIIPAFYVIPSKVDRCC